MTKSCIYEILALPVSFQTLSLGRISILLHSEHDTFVQYIWNLIENFLQTWLTSNTMCNIEIFSTYIWPSCYLCTNSVVWHAAKCFLNEIWGLYLNGINQVWGSYWIILSCDLEQYALGTARSVQKRGWHSLAVALLRPCLVTNFAFIVNIKKNILGKHPIVIDCNDIVNVYLTILIESQLRPAHLKKARREKKDIFYVLV